MSLDSTRQILDFDPETGEYRTTYDYPMQPPSVAVPLALMEVTGEDVTDFDPLYEARDVDPDALDDMFRPDAGSTSRGSKVTFSYHDFDVSVESYGRIVIRPDDRDRTQYL